jgi:hypothetical protein
MGCGGAWFDLALGAALLVFDLIGPLRYCSVDWGEWVDETDDP